MSFHRQSWLRPNKAGVVFSYCHQLLLLMKLVFHQAGLPMALETTDKEVGPLLLKSKGLLWCLGLQFFMKRTSSVFFLSSSDSALISSLLKQSRY